MIEKNWISFITIWSVYLFHNLVYFVTWEPDKSNTSATQVRHELWKPNIFTKNYGNQIFR